jgi:Holliday junction resolvase-like predicted endonuclease
LINFNSPNKKTGDNFEDDVVSLLQENGCTGIQNNLIIKDLGIEVDVCYIEDGKLVFGECKGGKDGAERTDNVKKAVASAPLIKKKYPNSIFNLFFSKPPKKNSSSDNMLKKYMEYGYVDNIVYVIPSDNKTASLETFL